MLYVQLSQAARDAVADLEQFEAMWRSVEMKEIWEHVGDELKKDNGRLLQPTGMWERDYGLLWADLVRQRELERQDSGGQKAEDAEAAAAAAAAKNWREEVQAFSQKDLSGVRVVADQRRAIVGIALVTTGILLQARADGIDGGSPDKIPEWWVSSVDAAPTAARPPKTQLETDICDWMNRRPHRWDITYLLVRSTFDLC